MRPRHAVALALVGWYLMVPPTGRDYPRGNVDAPLTQWIKRRRRPIATRTNVSTCWKASPVDELEEQADRRNFYKQAQCIANDDPRLKEK